jgi:CxxC motif-containing protein (DUF1111 family)
MKRIAPLFCAVTAILNACGSEQDEDAERRLEGLTTEQVEQFVRGDKLFEKKYEPKEGIGPVFIQNSCELCHDEDSRGPATVTRMVVMNADDVTRSADQSALPFGSVVRPRFLEPPLHEGVNAPTGVPHLNATERFGPAVFGRGWLEAVDAREIEKQAQLQEGRVEHGRVPRLPDGRLGRFGLKARVASLEDFTADAFNGDMGLTSMRFQLEPLNPAKERDDQLPGLDISEDVIQDVSFYVRTLRIPDRTSRGLTLEGRKLFEDTRCGNCHVRSMKTSADFPIKVLAGQDAEIYSDMLLHDMGTRLADGIVEGAAREREWRTAPLIGISRLNSRLLHDGRASTVGAAILEHSSLGSEANMSVELYRKLTNAEKEKLESFVRSL